MFKRLFALLALCATLAVPAHAESERENIIETFSKLQESVGALYAQEPDGDMTFLCSATAIDRYRGQTVILTANHCLEKGVSYLIDFGDRKLRGLRVWKIPHYEVDETEFPRKYNEPETDMALFLMEGADVPLAPMARSSRVEDGTKVVMVGYPLGVSKISYEGIVAGRFDRRGANMYDYLLLQIFGSPGSSGSAVVNTETGKIVGVLVSAKESIVGLPVIFATPVEYRRYLMEVRPDDKGSPE